MLHANRSQYPITYSGWSALHRAGLLWGASRRRQPPRGKSVPLWAEGGQWGPKAAPGDDVEALVGQTSSSGVRLSDALFSLLRFTPPASRVRSAHAARPRENAHISHALMPPNAAAAVAPLESRFHPPAAQTGREARQAYSPSHFQHVRTRKVFHRRHDGRCTHTAGFGSVVHPGALRSVTRSPRNPSLRMPNGLTGRCA